MRYGLKRILALTAFTFIAAGYGLMAYHTAAMAEEEPAPTVTPEPIATIILQAEPAPTPGRVPRPQAVVYDYHIGRSYIETVARGMYGLNTAKEKLAFAFLVINRLFCDTQRKDGNYLFARDITAIVEQAGEFGFYSPDAPLTDENVALAELGLNVQMTFLMTKEYTGYIFPSTLLYMGFDKGEAVFYSEIGGEAWRVK